MKEKAKVNPPIGRIFVTSVVPLDEELGHEMYKKMWMEGLKVKRPKPIQMYWPETYEGA